MGSNTRGRSRLLRGLAWTGGVLGLAALTTGAFFYLTFYK